MSVPIGLQFGESSGNIVNQSFAVDSNGRYVGLQVQPGKTLALVGGDVVLDGSNITAEAGRIELGSVASPSRVSLTPTAQGWTLGYEGVQNFRDIQLTQGAVVQTYPNMGEGGGDIQVQGRRVTVSDGSFIADITGRSPSAGILTVSASESVKLIGSAVPATDAPQSASSLRSDTLGAGNAGDLRITTGKLIVQDGAQVSVGTTTGSTGRGGTLTVNAASVELSGTSADGQLTSGLSAQSRGIGRAGNLKIATGLLSVRDQAQVTVGSLGLGATGNLEVTARTIHLDHRGKLTAESNLGQGGDIKLHDFDLLLLRHGSQISTTAGNNQNGGNGGKITIDTAFIVAVPEENSDISANAFRGKGGNVQIAAEGIFGIQTQERNTPQSDITASGGQPSLNGVITINTPNVDPSRGLVLLPAAVVNLSGLIAQGCGTSDGTTGSQFVVTGHGGLPPNPGEPLSSDAIWEDARQRATTVNQHRSERVIAPKPSKQAAVPIVPATGWVFNNKGEVTLTALAPPVTPDIPWLTPTTCHTH